MSGENVSDRGEKTVVIVMTSGPSTPHRCATPFFMAMLLAAMDAQVSLFLTMEGVRLARKGVAENLKAMEGGKPIIDFVREAKAAGVRMYLCRPAMPGYEIDESEVIPEIDEIASGGTLADLVLSCDKALFF